MSSKDNHAAESLAPPHSLPAGRFFENLVGRQVLCHELQLRDMFGGSLNVTLRELLIVLQSKKTIFAALACTTALMVADMPGLSGMIPVWQIMVIWYSGLAVFLVLKHAILLGVAKLSSMRLLGRVYLPIPSAIEFFIVLKIAETSATAMSGESYSGAFLGSYFQFLLVLMIIESLFTHFVIPTILRERSDAEKAESDPLDALAQTDPLPEMIETRLEIGGRALRLDNICYITSEEHYLRIVLRHETLVLRGKLAEVTAAIPDQAGLLAHRSWWVARTMNPRLQRDGGRSSIILSDGTSVPVARARVKAVQDWLDTHTDW